jgi:probable phosphoglycerate mutase
MKNDKEIKIYIVRHGEAGKSWSEDSDPGLSNKGKSQSEDLRASLSEEYLESKFKIISSPLLRAQETAAPLQEEFNFNIAINKTYAEIPSPGIPLSKRSAWLQSIFKAKIGDLEDAQSEWRSEIINSIKNLEEDTIIFSHFMVINCIVGWLEESENTVSFYPDNCSITKISKTGDLVNLIKRGKELTTLVN